MTKQNADQPAVAATESGGPKTAPPLYVDDRKFDYEVVPGFFLQDAGDKNVDFEADLRDRSFGMLDQSPERWANLNRKVEELQQNAPDGVQYKVIILGRHGQGWHNYASDKYGVEKWEAEIAYKEGDDEITWGPDPELTPLGHQQTKAVGAAWAREIEAGAPVSKFRFFTSPLQRTCQTMLNSWGDVLKSPETWEDFREIYGSHTCDKRSPKRVIQERFPMVKIEPGFTEEDELWLPDDRETDAHMQLRARRYMDRIFGGEAPEMYISITGHGAIFRNLLAVIDHNPWPLQTGEVIIMVLKATKTELKN